MWESISQCCPNLALFFSFLYERVSCTVCISAKLQYAFYINQYIFINTLVDLEIRKLLTSSWITINSYFLLHHLSPPPPHRYKSSWPLSELSFLPSSTYRYLYHAEPTMTLSIWMKCLHFFSLHMHIQSCTCWQLLPTNSNCSCY